MKTELFEVEKSLAKIKPAEVRIVGWQTILNDLFVWEEKGLRELSQIDISNLIIENPTKEHIALLKEIDDKIKDFTKKSTQKETERKDTTTAIDGMKTRLMVIEKGYKELAEMLKPIFIKISKIKTEEEQKIIKRNADLSAFRTKMQTSFNNSVGAWTKYNQEHVTEVYKDALDIIEVEDLPRYISDIKSKHGVDQFRFPAPVVSEVEAKDPEMVAIYQDVFSKWDANKLASDFSALLDMTFMDFSIAKSQKEEAIKFREAEQLIEILQIEDSVQMENTLAIIEDKVSSSSGGGGSFGDGGSFPLFEKTRDIKKSYIIDMPHDIINMRQVNKAFYMNMNDCLAIYSGKDPWAIDTVKQGELLCKLKDKDKNFQPEGIVFKEVERV